jgi:hypothetical protein
MANSGHTAHLHQTLVHHNIPHIHVHNEAQGHKLHGHFDHYHPHYGHHHGHHGDHRPSSSHSHGSHGSRRPSATSRAISVGTSSSNLMPKVAAISGSVVQHVPLFDASCIPHALHTLGKHPLTLGFTFLGLNLHQKHMTDGDMAPLADYKNIMYVDISANSVSDLSVFRSMSCLTQINAW